MSRRIENTITDLVNTNTTTVDFVYDGNCTRAKKTDSSGDTTYYIGDHFEVANGEEVKYIFKQTVIFYLDKINPINMVKKP